MRDAFDVVDEIELVDRMRGLWRAAQGRDVPLPGWTLIAMLLAYQSGLNEQEGVDLKELQKKVDALEQLRPVWAMGYTEEGRAAQGFASALSALWLILGAENQTEAVATLREAQEALHHLAWSPDEPAVEHARQVLARMRERSA